MRATTRPGPSRFNRRALLVRAGAAGVGILVGRTGRTWAATAAKVDDIRVISHQANLYHGWPTLARRADGQLLLVYSGGRQGHICPFGRVELMRSHDGGETWSWPRVVLDGPIDDRDAGIVATAAGSILITTFTSLAYEPSLRAAVKAGNWPQEKLRAWQAAHQRIGAEARQRELGVWMVRSTDGGVTWSRRYDSLVDSPHGPVQLSDGRLLYAGVDLWRGDRRVGVCESTDDGKTWRWLAQLPTAAGDDPKQYHELHAVEAADGRLLVQVRNHNKSNARETLQSESADGGRTWSAPRSIGVWGLPSHLLRLADDRLLMTYGYRRKPFGNQARLSEDHGRSWSEPITVSADGVTGDLGYPSSVQQDDGSLVTVWYERLAGSDKAVLRQARWRLG